MPKKGTKKREHGDDYINTLGGRLNKVLETHPDPDTGKKMTQATLAEKIELSEKYISMIISGQRNGMSRKNIEKISALFGVRKEYLLLIDNYMTEEEERRAMNSAVMQYLEPLDLVEKLIISNGYKMNFEHPESGVVLLSPTEEMRLIPLGVYFDILKSVNNSLKEKLSLIYAVTPLYDYLFDKEEGEEKTNG